MPSEEYSTGSECITVPPTTRVQRDINPSTAKNGEFTLCRDPASISEKKVPRVLPISHNTAPSMSLELLHWKPKTDTSNSYISNIHYEITWQSYTLPPAQISRLQYHCQV